MKLELIVSEPHKQKRPHSILFIHGVYHGAWCWMDFMRSFSDIGYKCFALSLRGHGASDGREFLSKVKFSDYLEDVRKVCDIIGESPILIGHSLGGMLIRKHIETQQIPAAVLISTPTSKALIGGSAKLIRYFPLQILKMIFALNPNFIYKDPKIVRTLYFSREMPDERFNYLMDKFIHQDEPSRLFMDIISLNFSKPKQKIPTLVIGGSQDFGVHKFAFTEIAAFYDTTPKIIAGMPHDMILDNNWRYVANRIIKWLTQQGL